MGNSLLPPELSSGLVCMMVYKYRRWKVVFLHSEQDKRYKARAYPPGAELAGSNFFRARTKQEAFALIDRKIGDANCKR